MKQLVQNRMNGFRQRQQLLYLHNKLFISRRIVIAIAQKEEHIHIYGILYYCSMEKLVNLMLSLKERKPFDAIKSKISSFDITQYRNKLIKH